MYDIAPIMKYIQFLKQRCGLSVSLHPKAEGHTYGFFDALIPFNFHENSYCACIKRDPKANRHCIDCQSKVVGRCKNGPFNGTCHAGVRERVYPITDGTEVTGFLSVSGYRTKKPEAYFEKLSKAYGFSVEELTETYGSLNPQFPTDAELDTLLLPLCQMLELACLKDSRTETDPSLVQQAIRYIRQNRNQNITSRDICRHLSCSRSVMSTQFNKATGKSIREYINELRIADAKNLLIGTNLNVSEIAFSVGFSNSNYFSERFKEHVGIAPLKYRKIFRT